MFEFRFMYDGYPSDHRFATYELALDDAFTRIKNNCGIPIYIRECDKNNDTVKITMYLEIMKLYREATK